MSDLYFQMSLCLFRLYLFQSLVDEVMESLSESLLKDC